MTIRFGTNDMLVLVFYLGDDKYIIKYEKVREISPMVALKSVPHSPDYFAGVFNYRGMMVPVVDLRCFIQGQPCRRALSTRIILVDYLRADNTPDVFGLIAERITEAVRKPDKAFVSPGINMQQEAPYLASFVMEQENMIQCIDLDVLPDSLGGLPMLGRN
ncbi:MAG: purine-binding chemotaxis protein CheW [Gammaproteobacteria bacterium]|nr:purine-binding chemotaxis protein CheW [Gammaproteobacteria bacterium]